MPDPDDAARALRDASVALDRAQEALGSLEDSHAQNYAHDAKFATRCALDRLDAGEEGS